MDNQQIPERRHVLALKIGGDTEQAVLSLLNNLIIDLERGGLRSIITGGPDSGGAVVYATNETVTHEGYIAEIEAWMERRKAADNEGEH
jgi:hypothetical protein